MYDASPLSRFVVATALSLACGVSHAFVVFVDEFRLTRDGVGYFLDTFSDGIVPPARPSTSTFNCGALVPNCYGLTGTFNVGDEAGGKLRLDSAQGAQVSTASGNSRVNHGVALLTNRSDAPADVNGGLKMHRTFAASVLFDIAMPGAGDLFQLRLIDTHQDPTAPGHRSDYLAISLRRDTAPGAAPEIRFAEQNFQVGTNEIIDSVALDTALGADQLRFYLSHPEVNGTAIYASWDYLKAGDVVATGSFATPGHIFDGETFTRASFVVSVPIPEPESYAMILVGLGLVGFRLRPRQLRRLSIQAR